MQAFRQWFSARSLPIKIVFILLGAWLAIRVLQALYDNSFGVFLSSLAIFVFLLILHALRAGSDSDRLPEQTLGRWGSTVAAVAMVATVLFGSVALAKAVFGGAEPKQGASPESAEQQQGSALSDKTKDQTAEPTREKPDRPVAAVQKDEEDVATKSHQRVKRQPSQQPERRVPQLPTSSEDKLTDLGKVVTVSYVVDGDTIEISPAVGSISRVRLIGVDTPETYSGTEPYGEKASTFTTQRLEGRQVALEFDVERVDPYSRVLAYVWLPDGTMFNEELVREGYAQVATFPPNVKYVERFRAAQREARAKKAGLWGLPANQLCQLADKDNGIGGRCTAESTSTATPSPPFSDRDCADFDSQAEAQEVLEDDLSDPNGLDGDSDGVACEDLPGGSSASLSASARASASAPAGGGLPPAPGGDYDCSDLTYSQAQQVLRSDPSDPHYLDGDDDGEACEA